MLTHFFVIFSDDVLLFDWDPCGPATEGHMVPHASVSGKCVPRVCCVYAFLCVCVCVSLCVCVSVRVVRC